jgi:AraC-like DNA-binding protein
MSANLTDLLLSVRMEASGLALIELAADAHVGVEPVNRVIAHFVLEGSLTVVDTDGNSRKAGAGDFVVFSRGSRHRLLGVKPSRQISRFTEFRKLRSADHLAQLRLGGSRSTSALILSAAFGLERPERTRINARLPAFTLMHDEMLVPGALARQLREGCDQPGSGALAAAIVFALFINVTRASFGAAVDFPATTQIPDIAALNVPAIAASLSFLDRHLEKNWSVAELASQVGMSRSAFALAFTQSVGKPPLTYLTELRMQEADKLLCRHDDLDIATIAARTGYQSQAAFTRAYRRHFGMTPSARRKVERL